MSCANVVEEASLGCNSTVVWSSTEDHCCPYISSRSNWKGLGPCLSACGDDKTLCGSPRSAGSELDEGKNDPAECARERARSNAKWHQWRLSHGGLQHARWADMDDDEKVSSKGSGKDASKGTSKGVSEGIGKGADMGARKKRGRKAPSEKFQCQIFVCQALEKDTQFGVMERVKARTRAIWRETGAKLRLSGRGTGHIDTHEQEESKDDPALCICSWFEAEFRKAKRLASELILEIHESYSKYCFEAGKACPDLQLQIHLGPRHGSY